MTKPVGNSQDLYFAAEQPVTHEDESLVSLIDDLKYKIFCFLDFDACSADRSSI